ncbi:hypothetical protein [Peribacillus asahii]|uniref:hypothetical protein n=1 Tax=Peribacillus asahii TaxID=228899 RepID=UPI003823BC1B
MNKFEKDMKILQGRTEWARSMPTLKEKRQQKSSVAKFSKLLDHAVNRIEAFDSVAIINSNKWTSGVYLFFFPNAIEEIKSVREEKHQYITKEGNVINIKFG